MNIWLMVDIGLLIGVTPCILLMVRSCEESDWTAAAPIGGIVLALALLVVMQPIRHVSFHEFSLALALLSFPAGLMFAHFVEPWVARWLDRV